jgi:hypothetical protein
VLSVSARGALRAIFCELKKCPPCLYTGWAHIYERYSSDVSLNSISIVGQSGNNLIQSPTDLSSWLTSSY